MPSLSFGMCVVSSLRKVTDMVFDVHLMVEEPIRYIADFAKSGSDIITVHLEACSDVEETLDALGYTWEQIMADKRLLHGLKMAQKKITGQR